MARPKGSTTRPQIRKYMNHKEMEQIVAIAIKKAREGDVGMIKYMLDQTFGKAPQVMEMEGGMDINLVFDKIFKGGENGTSDITQQTETDNS